MLFLLMTQLPSPLWSHTGDAPLLLLVTATNICKVSQQATRALRTSQCSCGCPGRSLQLPWVSLYLRGVLHSTLPLGQQSFTLRDSASEPRAILISTLADGPVRTTLPCCPVLEDTHFISLCFTYSLRAPQSLCSSISADCCPGRWDRSY